MTSKAFENATDANRQQGGRRNLIINGAMQVAQRGTSFTGLTNGTGKYTLDRFKWNEVGNTLSTHTVSQDTDVPDGFAYSLKDLTTTGSTTNSDNVGRFTYTIEGQDLQHLGYGTANAKAMTFSFWVKSNQTGTATIWFYNSAVGTDRSIAKSYTINAADTWEYKTLTLPGDTVGVFPNTNGIGLSINFVYAAGSTYTSGTKDVWADWSAGTAALDQTLDVGSTTNDYIQITGVQLEVGSVATPFEHRSYGEELALCQRYFQRTDAFRYFPITRWHHNSGTPLAEYRMAVPMRSTVSVSVTPGATFASGSGYTGTPTFGGQTDKAFHITSATSRNANDNQWVHNGSLDIDAEL